MAPRNRDPQQLRNGLEVMDWIERLTAHPNVPIDLDLVRFFDKLVLQGTARDAWAGRLQATVDRQDPADWGRPRAIVAQSDPGLAVADVETGQLIISLPPDGEVDPLLDGLLAWLPTDAAQALDPIERAAFFHHEFARIHPFRDGNGRTARALTTLLLRRDGFEYEVLVLQKLFDDDRTAYIEVLREADAGDLSAGTLYLAQAVRRALLETRRLRSSTRGL